jgi:hypothetical protein
MAGLWLVFAIALAPFIVPSGWLAGKHLTPTQAGEHALHTSVFGEVRHVHGASNSGLSDSATQQVQLNSPALAAALLVTDRAPIPALDFVNRIMMLGTPSSRSEPPSVPPPQT